MESPKKARHTNTELIDVFNKKNIPDKFHSRFIDEYDRIYNEFYEEAKDWPDEDYEEDESVQGDALNVTFQFIESFLEQIQIGHGEEWAEIMAKYRSESEDLALDYAYNGVSEKDPAKAEVELLILCKYLNGDEHFARYLLYLFKIGEGYEEPLVKAKEYSNVYNKQIKLGKSDVFAHEYADLMAWEYVESFFDAFATTYEQSLLAGKSEEYARRYAVMYSDWIGERYGKLSEALKDRDFAFWNKKMIGNMKGWEYALENKLSDIKSFVEIFENLHINTYYADKPLSSKMNKEEIDKMILEQALERYEKLKVKKQ